MAYWDAQIWASARMNQISLVLSEDFGEGVVIDGVRFINPFGSDFNIENLLPVPQTT
jgi:predicted nucleic acid-binding protein